MIFLKLSIKVPAGHWEPVFRIYNIVHILYVHIYIVYEGKLKIEIHQRRLKIFQARSYSGKNMERLIYT